MKILYVITRSVKGGAQIALRDLITRLPLRFELVVAAGEEGFLQQECRRIGVPFRLIPHLVWAVRPIQDVIALGRLVALIRRERPDIVHAHTSKAGILARIAAWITGTPAVFTAHTWSFADGAPWLRRRLSIPLERFVAGLGGTILTVSDANRRQALRYAISSQQKIMRVWNGVPDCGLRAHPGIGRSETILIVVARLVPQKDHAFLLHALSTVGGNWRLWLVGDGPLLGRLRSLARQLGIPERIEFLGERDDVEFLLARSDIFLLPTKWEGFPISIIEAMRAGLPVIATDVAGVREAVVDGETGFLVPPGDLARLRQSIRTLLGSPEMRAESGGRGRALYERSFRIEFAVERTAQIYDSIHSLTKVTDPCLHTQKSN